MANTNILYLEAEKRDLVNKFLKHNTEFFLRLTDGKIDWKGRLTPDPPWYYHKPLYLQNCFFYHKLLFDILHRTTKVPIWCQRHCWKVVLAPRTLEELMGVYLLLKELDLPSKCGVEGQRENSNKLYGAYFYNISLAEGRACYAKVKKVIEEAKPREGLILNCPVTVQWQPDMPVILKRACTEFEQHCGPSDKWTWDETQEEQEQIFTDAFALKSESYSQNEYMIGALMTQWIHRAYQWGDETYKKFTNGNILFSPVVTFHDKPDWVPNFPDFTKGAQ